MQQLFAEANAAAKISQILILSNNPAGINRPAGA
jgi:hypothetical protein